MNARPQVGTTRCTVVVAFLSALALFVPAAAQAALQPIDLSVDGGEESWHAERVFALRWSNPAEPVSAVHYRVLDPSGQVAVGETTLDWAATAVEHLSIPPTPGAYTAEVWLEGAGGEGGAPATAKLRFDDAVPGPLVQPPAPGWIGRTAFPLTLHLGHPAGPSPLSGIAGYAASFDDNTEGDACLIATTCGAAEIAVSRGPDDDAVTVSGLPVGATYLHAVAVTGSGMRSALGATRLLRVDETDPLVRLAGNPSGWSNRPLTLTASATDGASGMTAGGDYGMPFTAIRVDGGVPTTAAGDTVTVALIASGIHMVAYYARDGAGNVADGGTTNGRANHSPATATVRIDREPPLLAFSGGQDPLDPERIEARATDALSGLDPDRGSIAVRRVGAGERFAELATERSGALLRARWNSDAYPAGEYEFRATAYDRAGNSATTLDRVGGSAMRLPSPLKVRTSLTGSVSSGNLAYGRAATFGGRLVAARGTPLAGMPVRVIERFEAGSLPAERVSMVRTGGDGAFRLNLEPGPSRQVQALLAPTATLRGASSRPATLAVRGAVRMRASSASATVDGRPIVFHGSVAAKGAAIPGDGKIVQLQFRLPGLDWSEFRTVRTDPRGRFRYAYRFADDDSRGVRFQFRAYAPAQAGWPFEPAGSAPVTVRGR